MKFNLLPKKDGKRLTGAIYLVREKKLPVTVN